MISLASDSLNQIFHEVLGQEGTLRDLLGALAEQADCVVPGATFRREIERFHLREAFLQILQDPQALERLDSVRAQANRDRTLLEFCFSQAQTVGQQTPLGTANLELAPRIGFWIDDGGDAELRRGDIKVRWLFLTEDVGLRLRRVRRQDGTSRDLVQISAADVISREVELACLSKPAAVPTGRAKATRAPAKPIAELPEPHTILTVVHQVPGRVRFRVEGLYRDPTLRKRLESQLRRHSAVQRASANELTGNLLLIFSTSLALEEVEQLVNRVVHGLEPVPLGDQEAERLEPWHLLDAGEVVRYWQTDPVRGLDEAEGWARYQRFGPNTLPEAETRSPFSIFVDQFKSLPVMILGASALLSIATGGLLDAVAIVGVVLINATVGFATENWSERTIAGLMGGSETVARAVREGRERDLLGERLVPGDLILLRRGMAVPADARLLEAENLAVDESILTGESMPVSKTAVTLALLDSPLSEQRNMVYRGTVITDGGGRAIVVATGISTEIGQIQRMLAEAVRPETPLQRQLRMLSKQLVFASLAICGGVLGIGLLRGRPWLQMLRTSVSLAVAAVPEGLPAVATTTLALAVHHLRAHGVLVRRLQAIETLGAVEYICLDKTGTITLNRMTLVAIFAGMTVYDVRDGQLFRDGQAVAAEDAPEVVHLLRISALCSEVEIQAGSDDPFQGSPTEVELIRAAVNAGLDPQELRAQHPLRCMRHRSQERAFMDTLHDDGKHGHLLAVKGRPDQVLPLCSRQLRNGALAPLSDDERAQIAAENEHMAGQALRVLGVAYSHDEGPPEETGTLIWVGLVGLMDPPREGMQDLMRRLQQAGIHRIMITGDQSATAHAIAREIGLTRGGEIRSLDSGRLAEIEPDVLRSLVEQVDVFSRTDPAQKLQIVQALQKSGRVVAMTGDGVNDGPALRTADVGVAMGQVGSQVAQEVADAIVADDNLETLIEAIQQGRTTSANIERAVHFILASNTSEILLMFTALTAGLGDPLTPLQLLWINLATDIFPELALGVEPPTTDVMERPPRNPNAPLFARQDYRQIVREGTVITAGALTAYGWGIARYGLGMQARTMAFTSLTAAQLLHALGCRSKRHSIFHPNNSVGNPYLALAIGGGLAAQVGLALIPGLRSIMGLAPLGLVDWAVCGALAVAPLIANETIKTVAHGRQGGIRAWQATMSLPQSP